MAAAVVSEWTGLAGDEAASVVATVPVWWEARARSAGLAPEWCDWRRALPPPPVTLEAAPVAGLELASPTALGEAYAAALDSATRLREGRHYTPGALAGVLWEEIARAGWPDGFVLDPACGAGALLLPRIRTLVAAADDPAAAMRTIAASVAGTDTDPLAVWIGNAVLGAELLPLWARFPGERRRPLPQLLRVGNGLTPTAEEPRLVVMNPPYGRVRLSAADRERWRESLYGHANRYALFLHAAIKRASPGGLIAAVLPTSFLGGAYYQQLRDLVARTAPLERIVFVDARAGVFVGDVLQETCLAIFRKAASRAPVACSTVSVNGSAALTRLPPAPAPCGGTAPWLLPRHGDDRRLIEAAARLPTRLRDYGWKASTGPLVWNRHKPQIHALPGRGRLPILWAADVEHGVVRRDHARDRQRWIALRPQDAFMALRAPAVLVQRTTAPEQPRRLVAAHLDTETLAAWGGAVVVENHVNVLRCSDPRSPLTAPLLERLLRTPVLDRLYRCLTGTVAVSAYELEALPLPPREAIASWHAISETEFAAAVAGRYGDAPP